MAGASSKRRKSESHSSQELQATTAESYPDSIQKAVFGEAKKLGIPAWGLLLIAILTVVLGMFWTQISSTNKKITALTLALTNKDPDLQKKLKEYQEVISAEKNSNDALKSQLRDSLSELRSAEIARDRKLQDIVASESFLLDRSKQIFEKVDLTARALDQRSTELLRISQSNFLSESLNIKSRLQVAPFVIGHQFFVADTSVHSFGISDAFNHPDFQVASPYKFNDFHLIHSKLNPFGGTLNFGSVNFYNLPGSRQNWDMQEYGRFFAYRPVIIFDK